MRASTRLVLPCLLALAAGGCGGADERPSSGATATAAGPPSGGTEARRGRAPAVLAALERAVGEDAVYDLTFEGRRFTVLTSWVTQEQHDHPATADDADAEVADRRRIALVCRTVEGVDPVADTFVAGYDGTSWLVGCPQNLAGRPPG